VRLESFRREDPEIITTATQPNVAIGRKPVEPVDSQSPHQTVLEPSLHKCLQALVKCYTDRLDLGAPKVSTSTGKDIDNYNTDMNSNASSLAHGSKATYTNNDTEINQFHIENKDLHLDHEPSEAQSSVKNSAKSAEKHNVPHNSRRPWK